MSAKNKARPKAMEWRLSAWLVARGNTPLRVILRSDIEGCAGMMMNMSAAEQIYPVSVIPLPPRSPARKRKAKR